MGIEGQGHFLTFAQRPFMYENENMLFSETTGPFLTKFVCKLLGTWKLKFIDMMLVT